MAVNPLDSTYGSDQHGLIWGYRFSPGRPAESITSDAYVAAMATPSPGADKDFFWLHMSLANASSETWMRQHFELPQAFFDSLRTEQSSTRLESDEDMLVAVIHDVLFETSFDTSAAGSASVGIGPRLLLSARLRPLRSLDKLREAVRTGHTFHSPVELLAHLLREQANVLSEILRRSTQRVDQVEDRILANRISITRAELGALRRSLVRLQRLLAPEPAAFFRLLNRPLRWITEDGLQELRQAAEEFSAAINDSALLVERVKLIQEELAAMNNEQTNRTLFVLTVVTVIALPINLISGLFGMNVGGIPFSGNEQGFGAIVITLVVLTSVLGWLTLGRKRD
ncbi:MAG TPA: transporter [Candidatus Acidoferrum sp.]|nr:transporter [Candidatus Acidoferrum sp.]